MNIIRRSGKGDGYALCSIKSQQQPRASGDINKLILAKET